MHSVRSITDISRAFAFSGHRDLPWDDDKSMSPLCQDLQRRLSQEIHRVHLKGIDTFLCGMALGADFLFAQQVFHERTLGLPLVLIAAIPSKNQSSRWSKEHKALYETLMSQCDGMYDEDPSGVKNFAAACILRNRWMVRNSCGLIAVYDNRPKGGTALTVAYAKEFARPVVVVPPKI